MERTMAKEPKVCLEHIITPPPTLTATPYSVPAIRMSRQKSRPIRTGNVFPVFCCLILLSLCELKPQFAVVPVLSWQQWNPVWSSATVAYLFKVQYNMHSQMVFCLLWVNSKSLPKLSGISLIPSFIYIPKEFTCNKYTIVHISYIACHI